MSGKLSKRESLTWQQKCCNDHRQMRTVSKERRLSLLESKSLKHACLKYVSPDGFSLQLLELSQAQGRTAI